MKAVCSAALGPIFFSLYFALALPGWAATDTQTGTAGTNGAAGASGNPCNDGTNGTAGGNASANATSGDSTNTATATGGAGSGSGRSGVERVMPSREHRSAAQQEYSAFIPLLLLAIVVFVGFQAGQRSRERQQLVTAKENPVQPLIESGKTREQLNTIVIGVNRLAESGNQNAITVRARLSELGLMTSPAGNGAASQ
ncbi:MAG: hypothetical protein HKN81_10720 [Gammaproteobacteria bacterium]|nr:hypothetical protein [Gammaproteobacteria bacterium]